VTTNRLTQAPRILAGPISAPSSANRVSARHTVCVVPKPPVASTFTRRGMPSRELSCPLTLRFMGERANAGVGVRAKARWNRGIPPAVRRSGWRAWPAISRSQTPQART
jgi:hypothetical protein